MPDSIVPPIDYTSRDYQSLRDDLLRTASQLLPEWTSRDEGDFGVALVELFAYVGDILNYYLDKIGNEAYLSTAIQRQSILAIADMFDYVPAGMVPAKVPLTLYNSGTEAFTVPAYTQCAANIEVEGAPYTLLFETDVDVEVPAATGETPGGAIVAATQGQTYFNETVGTSTGESGLDLVLFHSPVHDQSVHVYVNETGTPVEWSKINNLLDAGSSDPVYRVYTDVEGFTHILFGDNKNGRIPNIQAEITATYRVADGSLGNVGVGYITTLVSPLAAPITVNNLSNATGGADEESTDLIRYNIPRTLRTVTRATTLADYEGLALAVTGIDKAAASAQMYNNVQLYVAPTGGGQPTTSQIADVQTYLADKIPATTTVTINGPTYVPIDIDVDLSILPNYLDTSIEDQVSSLLEVALSSDNTMFGQTITQSDVVLVCVQVDGIASVTVNTLATNGGTGVSDITLGPQEIPIAGTITVTATSL